MVYATHSPFMIFDYTVEHLLTVELDRDSHLSTIRATYSNSKPETLIPILQPLGAPEAFLGVAREMSKRPVAIVERQDRRPRRPTTAWSSRKSSSRVAALQTAANPRRWRKAAPTTGVGRHRVDGIAGWRFGLRNTIVRGHPGEEDWG
jgi:hypothetical protein